MRKIYNETEVKIKNRQLFEKRKSFEYSQPYVPTLKIIYFDAFNKVRKYIEEVGSDDSNLTYRYYYDNRQILRFVFIISWSVNGSVLEHRIYFDKNAERIWEIQTYIKGQEYTFPKKWPKDQLMIHGKDFMKEIIECNYKHTCYTIQYELHTTTLLLWSSAVTQVRGILGC